MNVPERHLRIMDESAEFIASTFAKKDWLWVKQFAVDAKDLKQEALMRALRHYHKYNRERGTLKTFVNPYMVGAIQDLRRSYYPRFRENSQTVYANPAFCQLEGIRHRAMVEPDAMDRLEADSVSERVQKAIDRLPKRLGLVVRLHFFEEMTLCGIAKILGVDSSRASQMLGEAKRLLRRMQCLMEVA